MNLRVWVSGIIADRMVLHRSEPQQMNSAHPKSTRAKRRVIDYRGFGESCGYEELGEATVDEDALAALRYLKDVRRFAPHKIFIHGKEDKKVPFNMSKSLHKAVGGVHALCLIEGAGHENCGSIGKVEYRRHLDEFITACLKKAEPGD